MDQTELQFWYFLIKGKLDDSTGGFCSYFSYGHRCGVALENIYAAAKKEGISKPTVIEMMRLDDWDDYKIPEAAIKVSENSFRLPGTDTFSLNSPSQVFTPPKGIAFSTEEGDFESELIKEGFVAYTKDENGVYEFQMVVDNSRLIEVFFKCANFIEPVDSLLIEMMEHWEMRTPELWAGKALCSKKEVLDFLKEHQSDTLENGFVELIVHSPIGLTNLRLCEHKKIQLHTESLEVFNSFIRAVINLGFKQTRDLYNIEYGYHHWHYRPSKSLNRDEFTQLLMDLDFEKLNLEI
ncbi:hypothetical protein [Croceimicrobium hydrocarbonivorans]|uniref:Uncharacterized protein n=1 Tax=Croceimicrobium hydrocarbonivorans TaxID=2761580 RepID=A0A7H0VHG2_9FLAO|nr:hypothetical protein [Croceimicrobium hydrocarbonivorans]QNR25160.1 hypothetical protein H4K34_04795 [Croceimicrobium hydrocarbonivorans]